MLADPDLNLSRDNMFLESFIPDIKAAKLTNFEFYNLRDDPRQEDDRAARDPAGTAAMREQMLKLHADVLAEAYDWHATR